ncbi:MAG: hypothetical protein AVW05_03130 [Hadesarchaea archaeon DG-33]|nr:MAG: hypothetical protein AVW05_03130 [Hadesarchaea archaeon DG-33]
MRGRFFGMMMALVVLGVATITSYVVLDHFYGEGYFITSTQTVIIENSGEQVSIDDVRYDVENVEFLESTVVLKYYGGRAPDPATGFSPSEGFSPMISKISVPTNAYEQAQATGEPVTVSSTTTTETKPVNAWPIAAGIGISMGVMVFAVWAGYQEMRGSATSTLLEHGLHDMTVRDVEIVGHIMKLEEFTIPELMKLTKTSKITIWRTVQKLVEQELVQPTEQTKLAANGLGGRGKPSRVYRYVGKTKT